MLIKKVSTHVNKILVYFAKIAFCLGFIFTGINVWSESKSIHLKVETIRTTPVSFGDVHALGVQPLLNGLFIVQFKSSPEAGDMELLKDLGIRFLKYLPDDSFLCVGTNVYTSKLLKLSTIQWVGPYLPKYKIHPGLFKLFAGKQSSEKMQIRVLLRDDAGTFLISHKLDVLSVTKYRFGIVANIRSSVDEIQKISASDSVLWIEPEFKPKLFDEVSTKIVAGQSSKGEHFARMHELGFDGKGVVVAVADTGLCGGTPETVHPDLAGRVRQFFHYGNLTDAADEHSHGTHVAGIIAGDGATGETDEDGYLYGLGVAPKAELVIQRIFDGSGNYEPPPTFEVLTRDATQAGAVIGSNSWGDDTQGQYDLSAAEFDALVRDADQSKTGDQPYILEFSAGNAGPGVQTIGSPAVAKNVIASGASQNNRTSLFIYTDGPEYMADFSSRGPCEDGRIKPDVVAPGTWIASLQSAFGSPDNSWLPISENYQYEGGTSQSGPHVSGAAAIFVQYYKQTYSNTIPSPALVKAALINSAVGLESETSVPNMNQGWGRVDLTRLIASNIVYQFIDQSRPLANGQKYDWRFYVANNSTPLKVTLAYTDAPGMPAVIPALVNDLDLELIAPDGIVYKGNQFGEDGESLPNISGKDYLNNVEAIYLSKPLVGEYKVRVIAARVVEDVRLDTPAIDQDFALVISGGLAKTNQAVLFFNREFFSIPSVAEIKLYDPNPLITNSINLLVTSTTETNGELITLTPSGVYGLLTGVVQIVSGQPLSDGLLQASNGDIISASYHDIYHDQVVTATAQIDTLPPQTENLLITNKFGKVIISWDTDEPASSVFYYGAFTNSWVVITNTQFSTHHIIELGNLSPDTTYYFQFELTDRAGNKLLYNNGGQPFSFQVNGVATVLLVDAYEPDEYSDPIPVTEYTDILDEISISYDVWNVIEAGKTPGLTDLKPYQLVIWRISDSFWSLFGDYYCLSDADMNALSNYVNQGGALFISSMEILSRLNETEGGQRFYKKVLHVDNFNEDVGVSGIVGIDSDPISAGINLWLDYSMFPYDEFFEIGPDLSDTIIPSTNAAPVFFDVTSNLPVGLKYPRTGEDATGRVVFLSIPFESIPKDSPAPNNRANILRNIISFLVPGINGIATITFDKSKYTVPSMATVELADSDLRGATNITVNAFSDLDTDGRQFVLYETVRPGLFRGFIPLVPVTNEVNKDYLRVTDGSIVRVTYYDESSDSVIQAVAQVDTVEPEIQDVAADADYISAYISWQTSKPADSLVQFGESVFLGRTSYDPAFKQDHGIYLEGLQPDRLYYFKVVSRDEAGNFKIDDNDKKLYVFRTLKPFDAPWYDNLESGITNWTTFNSDWGAQWKLGPPDNGLVSSAHSPPNAWGSNLDGGPIDEADCALITPAINLTGGNSATLKFWHVYDFTPKSDFDIYEFGEVYITTNAGVNWDMLKDYSYKTFSWEQEEIDISQYAGKVVWIGWYYGMFSMDDVSRPGWLIDDVSIELTNIPYSTMIISNNLSQAEFTVSGPLTTNGTGTYFVLTNLLPGVYIVSFNPVKWYDSPPPSTNNVEPNAVQIVIGNYSFPDANKNGISDYWENYYFGRLLQESDNADPDGDGAPNLVEFLAGTDPTNKLSRPLLLTPHLLSETKLRLNFLTSPGYSYRFWHSENLVDWHPVSDYLRAVSTQLTYDLIFSPGKSLNFWRLEIKP